METKYYERERERKKTCWRKSYCKLNKLTNDSRYDGTITGWMVNRKSNRLPWKNSIFFFSINALNENDDDSYRKKMHTFWFIWKAFACGCKVWNLFYNSSWKSLKILFQSHFATFSAPITDLILILLRCGMNESAIDMIELLCVLKITSHIRM